MSTGSTRVLQWRWGLGDGDGTGPRPDQTTQIPFGYCNAMLPLPYGFLP